MNNDTKIKKRTSLKERLKEKMDQPCSLELLNDDHNTFEWVILCLMEVLNHTYETGLNIANIVHTHGGCEVKRGTEEEIDKYYTIFIKKGLTCKIEYN